MAIDDNTLYGLKGSQLKDLPKKINAVKGLAKELTADDYNWPTSNPNGVALWLLNPGIYYTGAFTQAYLTYNEYWTQNGNIFIVGETESNVGTKQILFLPNKSNQEPTLKIVNPANGAQIASKVMTTTVIDNLISTSSVNALSANQGKILNEKIEGRVIQNAGAPTTSTVGTIGLLLEDTTNGKLYVCTNIDNTDPSNPVYTWKEVGSDAVKELTSDDYNYPTDNPTRVAFWLLKPGMYYAGNGVALAQYAGASPSGPMTIIIGEQYGTDIPYIYTANTSWYKGATSTTGSATVAPSALSPNVVQTTGTSTTDVMSQNAVTGMIFADPSATHRVRVASTQVVGDHSTTVGENAQGYGVGSTALGCGARVYGEAGIGIGREVDNVNTSYKGTVAIGAYSGTGITASGMMDIGTRNTTYGYNSSNYRLLTGLYDPQDDHDAANKEYVDNSFGKARALTSDDYNWPTDNPDGVALWLLEPGLYISQTNTVVYTKANNTVNDGRAFLVSEETSGFVPIVQVSSNFVSYGSISASTGVPYADYVALNTTITQTTGTSTTDVMSQNAVTSMVYADPSTRQRVQMGDNSGANGFGSVAIGASAKASADSTVAIGSNSTVLGSYKGSVALGSYSKPTSSGQVDISVQGVSFIVQNYSYNNSGYRLLPGLYDPQSEHDAANKQYVDNAVSDIGSISNNTLYL